MNYAAFALQYLQMIEVFKTNVSNSQQADEIIGLLRNLLPGSVINFDLEDCDKILRIDYSCIDHKLIISNIELMGFECSVLQ